MKDNNKSCLLIVEKKISLYLFIYFMFSIYFCCFCKLEIMVKNIYVEYNCYLLMKVLFCFFVN